MSFEPPLAPRTASAWLGGGGLVPTPHFFGWLSGFCRIWLLVLLLCGFALLCWLVLLLGVVFRFFHSHPCDEFQLLFLHNHRGEYFFHLLFGTTCCSLLKIQSCYFLVYIFSFLFAFLFLIYAYETNKQASVVCFITVICKLVFS